MLSEGGLSDAISHHCPYCYVARLRGSDSLPRPSTQVSPETRMTLYRNKKVNESEFVNRILNSKK